MKGSGLVLVSLYKETEWQTPAQTGFDQTHDRIKGILTIDTVHRYLLIENFHHNGS